MRDDSDSEGGGGEATGRALHAESLHKQGKLVRRLAKHVALPIADCTTVNIRGRCVTSLAVTQDDTAVYMGDMNGEVYRYDMGAQKLTTLRCLPRSPIHAISCNFGNSLFATGHADAFITLWDSRTGTVIDRLGQLYGHRGPVYGLAFQRDKESILFSASKDRTVKMWACDDRVYMRTLFGHKSAVLRIHALKGERAVSVSDDKQARMWKTEADTVLAYRTEDSVLEDAAMLSEYHFLTTSSNGAISLYHRDKQKPLAVRRFAHGYQHTAAGPRDGAAFSPSFGSYMEKALASRTAADNDDSADAAPGAANPPRGQPNWVHSVATMQNADLFATGSCDGAVRLWQARVDVARPGIHPIGTFPAPGWVNGLAFANSSQFVVACTGPHHRIGRWLASTGKGARNALVVARLQYDLDVTDVVAQASDRVQDLPLPPPRSKTAWKMKRARAMAKAAEARAAAAAEHEAAEELSWLEATPEAEAPEPLPPPPSKHSRPGRSALRPGNRSHGSYLPAKRRRSATP